ncbi:MAG: DUF116 domain-containing protein [Candidatus Coatesbacteria bacterium]|nr:DUF116 domain-containing protein [Candidatus Coatesbacteria bacterium]
MLVCLTWLAWALLSIATLALARVFAPHLSEWHTALPITCYVLSSAFIALLAMGILSTTAARLQSAIILFHPMRKVIIKLVLPIAFLLGKVFGYSKDRLMLAFVHLNNGLSEAKRLSLRPEEVIVLLPQCLQGANCERRITVDISNCRRCGKCDIGQLADLFEKYSLEARVVPGGTLARKVVEVKQPRAIIAVACERELFAGIQDTHPIPVVSVVNDRPNGPCVETKASVELVEKAIRDVLGLGERVSSVKAPLDACPKPEKFEHGSKGVDDTN